MGAEELFEKGKEFHDDDEFDEAMKCYEEALDLFGRDTCKSVPVWQEMALIKDELADFDTANEYFATAVAILKEKKCDKNSAIEIYFRYGNVLFKNTDYAKAKEMLKESKTLLDGGAEPDSFDPPEIEYMLEMCDMLAS